MVEVRTGTLLWVRKPASQRALLPQKQGFLMQPSPIVVHPILIPASQLVVPLALITVVLLLLTRPRLRGCLGGVIAGLVKLLVIVGLIGLVVLFALFLARSAGGSAAHVPGAGAPPGSSSGGGTNSRGGYAGTLSVSDDSGYLFVNGTYIGQGIATVTLAAGSYTLYAISPSTGHKCWETGIRVDGGRTTTVRYSVYCQ